MTRRKEKSVFREYAESIIFAIVLAFILRSYVVQAFKIPSGSMEQTLLVGDHILVNKFLYRFTHPKRFDIIVFKYPWEEDRDFIKRVIAVPGDRVQVRNRRVYVNDRPLQEPYAQYAAMRLREGNFGPLVVPKKGDTIEIRRDGKLYLNDKPIPIPSGSYRPRDDHGVVMTGFEVFYGALFPPGTTLKKPSGQHVVQHDYYFALGDNRDNSKDSRYWGFVRSTRIKGKAFFIYWSWNHYGSFTHHIRWDRLGKLLQLAPAGSFAISQP
jgi:signal peptidase I